jgi:hypothetical protein
MFLMGLLAGTVAAAIIWFAAALIQSSRKAINIKVKMYNTLVEELRDLKFLQSDQLGMAKWLLDNSDKIENFTEKLVQFLDKKEKYSIQRNVLYSKYWKDEQTKFIADCIYQDNIYAAERIASKELDQLTGVS